MQYLNKLTQIVHETSNISNVYFQNQRIILRIIGQLLNGQILRNSLSKATNKR